LPLAPGWAFCPGNCFRLRSSTFAMVACYYIQVGLQGALKHPPLYLTFQRSNPADEALGGARSFSKMNCPPQGGLPNERHQAAWPPGRIAPARFHRNKEEFFAWIFVTTSWGTQSPPLGLHGELDHFQSRNPEWGTSRLQTHRINVAFFQNLRNFCWPEIAQKHGMLAIGGMNRILPQAARDPELKQAFARLKALSRKTRKERKATTR